MFEKNRTRYIILAAELLLVAFLFIINNRLGAKLAAQKERSSSIQEFEYTRVVQAIATPAPVAVKVTKSETEPQKAVLSASDDDKEVAASYSNKSYKIAVIGDSMVDTMGDFKYLADGLKNKFPGANFTIYNYGIGSENIHQALERFGSSYSYHSREYPSIAQIQPDIIVVGSYAYNPLYPYDRDQHWLALAQLIKKAKDVAKKTYVLAEIAPLEEGFGQGPNGIDWSENLIRVHVIHIVEQLENAMGLAEAQDVGLIDVYSQSLESGSKFGKKEYVDGNDGIHPSEAGVVLTSKVMTSAIELP
jgi:hypothetical protein